MSSTSRRPLAALASALFPGWGQVYLGEVDKGRKLLLANGVIILVGTATLAWLRLDALKLWVSSTGIALMMAANLALLGYRWLATIDAWNTESTGGGTQPLRGAAITVLALVLVVPHVAFGYLASTQYSLLDTVFDDGGTASPATTTTTLPPSSTEGTAPDSTTTTVAPSTTVPEPALWDGVERLNIALFGADAGAGRRGLRTDTTIVVSIDPETGDVAMFSVPRDFSAIPLPGGLGPWDCNCFPDLITHLYAAAEERPEDFPGPDTAGINALKAALGGLFGITIHHYALVTLDGFVDIVDALGGVTIEVPVTIRDETYPHEDGSVEDITIEAGTRHLNGHEALAYSRIRRHSDDFARMHRQRCVLGALVEQSSPTEILFRFGAIAEALKRSLMTDIPQERLADFVDLLPLVSTDRIASLRITRDEYQVGEGPGRVYYDIERIRADAQAMMDDPVAAIAELGLGSLDQSCDAGEEL